MRDQGRGWTSVVYIERTRELDGLDCIFCLSSGLLCQYMYRPSSLSQIPSSFIF